MKPIFAAALLAATASLGGVPALAGTGPILPAPTVFAGVTACTTTPCENDFSQSAGARNVTLPQFGKNYTVTNVDLSHIPTIYTTSQNTPGELVVGDVLGDQYSVATANGSPKVTAAASLVTGVGGTITDSSLTYYFEVIPDQGQGALTPVTVGLTANGEISGSSTSPVNGFDSLNGANVTAQFLISNTLDETAQAYFSYVCVLSDNDCSQSENSSTSNVTVHMGPTSTYSGGFNLVDQPLDLITDHPYQVIMTAEMSLSGAPGSAMASVDPMITVPVGYTLDLSPGISGVPEPATWASMLVGLGLVGGLARRRRATARLLAA